MSKKAPKIALSENSVVEFPNGEKVYYGQLRILRHAVKLEVQGLDTTGFPDNSASETIKSLLLLPENTGPSACLEALEDVILNIEEAHWLENN